MDLLISEAHLIECHAPITFPTGQCKIFVLLCELKSSGLCLIKMHYLCAVYFYSFLSSPKQLNKTTVYQNIYTYKL